MTTKLRWAAAMVLAAVIQVTTCAADADAPLQRLEIDTASGPHLFKVELMSTDAEREKGLMYRRSLAKDRGMLFDFHTQQPVTFWMENTYIPLDMIFVAKDGRVVSIKHDAKPLDRSLIPSGAPTLGVIEVNAGIADAIGAKVGDLVKHPMFHDMAGAPAGR